MKTSSIQDSKNELLSMTKGLGIILMVIGHSGCPSIIDNFIYMFHVPLFFIISGVLFKDEKYLLTFKSNLLFVKRRVLNLYIPYVKYSLLFLLLHNSFFHINIYNSIYGSHGSVSHLYGIEDYINMFISIITLRGTEQLLGGYWFIEDLFWGGGIISCSYEFFKNIYYLHY